MSSETVAVLFSKHSIDEIREVEKKTRQEIETKKEDLRQMVGERYRDLIEAADTIAEMKLCAHNLNDSVKSLQKFARLRFNQTVSLKKDKQRALTMERYMEISAQVKLIMDVSETIWSQIENGNMIEATHLYLQSRQVLKNLNLDGSTTFCPILSWFPILGQQAQALDNLRTTILTECRKIMSDDAVDCMGLAEAICSTILLEGGTIAKAFEEFLKIRLAAVGSKFKSSKDMGTVKLSNAIALVTSTVMQINALFVSNHGARANGYKATDQSTVRSSEKDTADGELVQQVLEKSIKLFHESTDPTLTFNFSEDKLWAKHLPDSVSRLVSMTDSNSGPVLDLSSLQAKCQQWMADCEKIVQNGTSDILLYVANFKGLNALRDTLLETLHEESGDVTSSSIAQDDTLISTEKEISEWQQACVSVLGNPFSIWQTFMKDLFLGKVKLLCDKLFSDLLTEAKQSVQDTLRTINSDKDNATSISEFIWSECAGDILPDTAWRQVSIKKSRDPKGGLGLKGLAVTPTLHQVCQHLNSAVRQAILDLSSYVPDIAMTGKEAGRKSEIMGKETAAIRRYFQESCTKCVHDILVIFREYRDNLSSGESLKSGNLMEILFLGSFCRNFCLLCGEFRNGCTLGDNTDESHLKRQMSLSMTSSTLSDNHVGMSAVWEDVTKKFSEESSRFFEIWSAVIVEGESSKFRRWLLDFDSSSEFFNVIAGWENIKIEEESESGSKVESEIKVPFCASCPVQDLLFSISNRLSRVGGHSFSGNALQNMTKRMWSAVLSAYVDMRNLVSNDLTENDTKELLFQATQSWALQKLFDLRVCHGVLYSNSSSKSADSDRLSDKDDMFATLVDWLEGYIDPFDLDVFTPYLTKNVQRAVNSTRSLFGFISAEKADYYQSTNQSSKAGGNSHNIMPLVPDCPRFSYLPISTKSYRRDKVTLPASVKNSLPLSSALQQLTEVDKKMESGRKQSLYSKFGALGSSWLSSITSEN